MTRAVSHRADGQPSDVDCGCCGRFIGPELTCPYCGAEAEQRGSVRLLRGLAVALALGGLLALGIHARHSTAPLVRVGDLTPGMSQASVRIAGAAVTAPRVSPGQGQPDYVSFDVDDGSGRVTVAAARRVARTLATEAGALPRRGDRVEAQGRLNVTADRRPRLYLDDAADLRVAAVDGESAR